MPAAGHSPTCMTGAFTPIDGMITLVGGTFAAAAAAGSLAAGKAAAGADDGATTGSDGGLWPRGANRAVLTPATITTTPTASRMDRRRVMSPPLPAPRKRSAAQGQADRCDASADRH